MKLIRHLVPEIISENQGAINRSELEYKLVISGYLGNNVQPEDVIDDYIKDKIILINRETDLITLPPKESL